MKTLPLLLSCLLATAPALAQTTADGSAEAAKLDLSLPKSATTTAPGYREDAPGVWYGDTSGVPAKTAAARKPASRCPTAPDGKERSITGSVATGIGYTSHYGSSNWNAAQFNYCKEYADDDGDTHSFNLNINVGRFDGPDGWRRGDPRPPFQGNWPRH